MTPKKIYKTMTTTVNKLIVSNRSILQNKYAVNFANTVQPAIQALITADAARGINTIAVYLDDATAMNAAGGTAVNTPTDEQQNKNAIDAVFNFYNPDYLMLLGASDVIPHQTLANPVFTPGNNNGDLDPNVPSDLPYACPGPYSPPPGDIKAFLNPTRVVGRLPDVNGGGDASVLTKVLSTAAGFTPRPASVYQQYLGVSAAVWQQSTQLSLQAAFGNASTIQIVPPQAYTWTPQQLALASHFFNCHGASTDPHYYGQPADGSLNYPIAQDASYIAGKITQGTVCAVECCYGAELYNPGVAGGQMGICNQYMIGGAYGFFGSTTIAYGPSDSNDYADVLCREFFVILLAGASLGRAVLQARQNYIASRAQLTAVDLKTIAQFYLLGDPSVQPVASAAPKASVVAMKGGIIAAASSAKASAAERAERRAMLVQNGLALGASVGLPGKAISRSSQIQDYLLAEIKELGVNNPVFASYAVDAPVQEQALMKMAKAKGPSRSARAIHLVIGRLPTPKEVKTPRIAGLEIVEFDGTMIERRFHSR